MITFLKSFFKPECQCQCVKRPDRLLRDEFAMVALMGITRNNQLSLEVASRLAYEYADMMLLERINHNKK